MQAMIIGRPTSSNVLEVVNGDTHLFIEFVHIYCDDGQGHPRDVEVCVDELVTFLNTAEIPKK